MKIGLFTSGYQRNPLEHAFEDAKRFGYDYIELWGARPHAYPYDLKNGDIEEIKRLIKKYDMPVLGYTPEMNAYPYSFMIGSETMRQDSMNYLKISMDMAKEMGATFTLISASHAGYETSKAEIRERLYKSLRELEAYASSINHILVLEALTHFESNVCTSANDLREILDEIDSPHLKGMCDIVPPFVQAESIMAYFNKLQDKMFHMHIVDSDGSSDTHFLPGEGRLPLNELMAELKDISYQRTATIELVTAYINEPRFYAKRAITKLREMMK